MRQLRRVISHFALRLMHNPTLSMLFEVLEILGCKPEVLIVVPNHVDDGIVHCSSTGA